MNVVSNTSPCPALQLFIFSLEFKPLNAISRDFSLKILICIHFPKLKFLHTVIVSGGVLKQKSKVKYKTGQ